MGGWRESDLVQRWQDSTTNHHMGVGGQLYTDQEFAGPLIDAGLTRIRLTRRLNYHRRQPPSKHNVHEIRIMLEGELRVSFGRRKVVTGPGTITVVPGTVPTTCSATTPVVRWMAFDFRFMPLWEPLESIHGHVREYEYMDCMCSLVERFFQAYATGGVAEKRNAIDVSEAILALLKHELKVAEVIPSKYVKVIEDLAARIEADPAADWTVKRMCKETGLPERTLARHCTMVTGSSLLGLVHRARVNRACKLLWHHHTIEYIAREVGCNSGEALSNLFCRHMGVRPSEYHRIYLGPWPVESP